ncbi:MFS transporter [Lysinibacillus sphaericus]|uniref:Multidrug-efflux transporter n=1 Tax=Lysinibacillus sphaericus OT4b.31 TaxID=1285586 RepID=R7Z9K6_LYSSH|nr:MFS transporter [Lysinibacillus sphaericus]EON70621.1 multidrug-efflux transporter [Lysinibacillus sphaericus OT4b.31]
MQSRITDNKVLILYLLSISTFFASLNQNIYTPVIPLIRNSFGISINWVNFTVGGFIFITALMQIALGSVIDSKSQKTLLLKSLIITSISTIACALSTNFTLFMIFRMFQAIGTAIIPLVTVNMIGQLFDGEARGSAMGTYQILLTLAPAISPIVGGVLGQHYGYSGIFFFLFAISVALLALLALILPYDKLEYQPIKSKGYFSKYATILANRLGASTMILSFFVFFVYFAILVYLPILLSDHYHVSLQIIGMLYLPLTISMIVGSLLYKRLQKKMELQTLFKLILLLMPLQVILFGFLHTHSLIGLSVVLFGYGMTVGFAPPLFATIISNEFSSNRGAALGLFNFIRYSGMAIGSIAAGLYKMIPVSLLFVVLGILLYFVSAQQYRTLKKQSYSSDSI